MDISKWSPMNPWDDFDKMISEMMPRGAQGFMPAVDVYETEVAVVAELTVPHMDPEQIDIAVQDTMLQVKGRNEKKSEIEEKNYYRKEIRSGSFFRTIPLPKSVISDQTTAELEEGVLKITMPKAEENKTKKIQIEVKKPKSS